jgi:hypothetical protein
VNPNRRVGLFALERLYIRLNLSGHFCYGVDDSLIVSMGGYPMKPLNSVPHTGDHFVSHPD